MFLAVYGLNCGTLRMFLQNYDCPTSAETVTFINCLFKYIFSLLCVDLGIVIFCKPCLSC